MPTTETPFTTFWRETDAALGCLGEEPARGGEIACRFTACASPKEAADEIAIERWAKHGSGIVKVGHGTLLAPGGSKYRPAPHGRNARKDLDV